MLNNPFCYTPSPSIVDAAHTLMARIDATPSLRSLFSEGKMLGILEVDVPERAIASGAIGTPLFCGHSKSENHDCSTRPTLGSFLCTIDSERAQQRVVSGWEGFFLPEQTDTRASEARRPELQSELSRTRPSMFLYAFSG